MTTNFNARLFDQNRVAGGAVSSRPGNTKTPFVVSVTSGKGGVGKTLTTVNIAIALRQLGLAVTVFDGDLGLANVDVVLGLQPRYNILDVLDDNVDPRDVVLDGPLGIRVIPSGSGISRLTQLSFDLKLKLWERIEQLGAGCDVLLIDTGAGIAENVIQLNAAAENVVVVTTPEPHAITDAYALIKVMTEETECRNFELLVNQTRSAEEGQAIAGRVAEVARRFLQVEVGYLGSVPYDPMVQQNVMRRRAANENATFTLAGQAWKRAAHGLVERKSGGAEPSAFWRNLVWSRPTTDLMSMT